MDCVPAGPQDCLARQGFITPSGRRPAGEERLTLGCLPCSPPAFLRLCAAFDSTENSETPSMCVWFETLRWGESQRLAPPNRFWLVH